VVQSRNHYDAIKAANGQAHLQEIPGLIVYVRIACRTLARDTYHFAGKVYRCNLISLRGQKSRECPGPATNLQRASTLIRNKSQDEAVIYSARRTLALGKNCDAIKVFLNLLQRLTLTRSHAYQAPAISYLNTIEHHDRKLCLPLLGQLAYALQVNLRPAPGRQVAALLEAFVLGCK
jgi:hypothetical protein